MNLATSKDDRKRKGPTPPLTENKTQSAKKKQPDEKKQVGFERGLEPEKILGKPKWPIFSLLGQDIQMAFLAAYFINSDAN